MNIYELIKQLENIIQDNPHVNFNMADIYTNSEYNIFNANLQSYLDEDKSTKFYIDLKGE